MVAHLLMRHEIGSAQLPPPILLYLKVMYNENEEGSKVVSVDRPFLSCGCREFNKILSVLPPVRSKNLSSDMLVLHLDLR
jgi:hypothetical protein